MLSLLINAKQIPTEAVETVEQFELPLNFFTQDKILIRKSRFKKYEMHHMVFIRGQRNSIPQIIKKFEYDNFTRYLRKLNPTRQIASACARFLDVHEFSNQKYKKFRLCVKKSKNNKDFESFTNHLIKKYKR